MDRQQAFWRHYRGRCARLTNLLSSAIIKKRDVGMDCIPICRFSALKGKYLEPAISSHPIEAASYEIRPDFIALVKELYFSRSMEENPYKHLLDFEELCATLMISGMNYEMLKWKTFQFSLTGSAKQWYKLHVGINKGSYN